MKKAILLFISCLLLLSLVSCSEVKETDAVLCDTAKELIERAQILNDVYWGKGLGPLPGGAVLYDEDFVEADISPITPYGISDMASLRDYTRSVYTENECENIFATYLTRSTYTDTFGDYSYTEVFTRYLANDEGILFVSDNIDDLIGDTEVIYDYDSLAVTERGRHTYKVEIKVTVMCDTDRDGYEDTLTLEIRKEDGKYRLCTPTYCVYDGLR